MHKDILEVNSTYAEQIADDPLDHAAEMHVPAGSFSNPVNPPAIDSDGVLVAGSHFLMNMCASNSMTLTNVAFVRDSVKELFTDAMTFLEAKTRKVLLDAGSEATDTARGLMADFAAWKNQFCGVDTQHKLNKYMERNHMLANPLVLEAGKRWDLKHKSVLSGSHEQVEIPDTFCYIPIEDSLRLVLQHQQSIDLIMSGANSAGTDGLYVDWADGKNGKQHRKYFDEHHGQTEAIPIFIQVYYDDVETTNPLGSKAGNHKIGAFYFVIKNFHPAVNSALHNIHLLALTHATDLKSHGFEPVLDAMVSDFMKLEEQGLTVELHGTKYLFKCFLSQIVGDNLGVHALFGYMQNFSKAHHACDLCMCSQGGMQTFFRETQLRTPALYDEQAKQLKNGQISRSDCGINKPCTSFQALKYYHPASNDSSDIMHDLLEGVIPLEVKLLIHYLVCK